MIYCCALRLWSQICVTFRSCWFPDLVAQRLDEYRMARRVLMAEFSGRRPRLGWMDGVKVALGNRGMTVKAEEQCSKDRKEWRALVQMQLNEFHVAIFA